MAESYMVYMLIFKWTVDGNVYNLRLAVKKPPEDIIEDGERCFERATVSFEISNPSNRLTERLRHSVQSARDFSWLRGPALLRSGQKPHSTHCVYTLNQGSECEDLCCQLS